MVVWENSLNFVATKSINMSNNSVRSLSEIAREIRKDWPVAWNENHPAGTYLIPMSTLDKVTDNYIMDSGKSIVIYFLSNASGWRGETSKRIKAELKAMIK